MCHYVIVYGYTFLGDKWLNSVVRDKSKTIVFDEDADDDPHPYMAMITTIKDLIKKESAEQTEITDEEALYQLYEVLNNIILSAPPLTKYDNIVLYRGERNHADDLMIYDINDLYINKGIWSTSLDPYTAFKFAGGFTKGMRGYVIEILVPAVLSESNKKDNKSRILTVMDCSMEEEFEVLLPSGCTFLVVDKKEASSKKLPKIVLFMIDQPNKNKDICK